MKSASSSFAGTAASKVTLKPVIPTATSQYVCVDLREEEMMSICRPLSNERLCVVFVPEKCARAHWHLPYRWQVLDGDGVTWKDLPNMEDTEKAYCDPEHDTSGMDQLTPSSGIFRFLSLQR